MATVDDSTQPGWARRSAPRLPCTPAGSQPAATGWPDQPRALEELLARWDQGIVAGRRERRMAVRLAAERAALPAVPGAYPGPLPGGGNPEAGGEPGPGHQPGDGAGPPAAGGDDDDPAEIFDEPC
jgi:hypothetical protein